MKKQHTVKINHVEYLYMKINHVIVGGHVDIANYQKYKNKNMKQLNEIIKLYINRCIMKYLSNTTLSINIGKEKDEDKILQKTIVYYRVETAFDIFFNIKYSYSTFIVKHKQEFQKVFKIDTFSIYNLKIIDENKIEYDVKELQNGINEQLKRMI